MTLDEACGVANPDGISWNERYGRYVRHIGRDAVRPFLPVKGAALARAWLADPDLNNVPLKRWEAAAGFEGYRDGQSTQPPAGKGPFIRLLGSKGITRFSMSECVSILKCCAELEARDYLSELMAARQDAGASDGTPLEIWAVFEHCSARTDKANRYNIFDFDCAAAFRDEAAAIRYEQENPGRRVRKLVTLEDVSADGGEGDADKDADA